MTEKKKKKKNRKKNKKKKKTTKLMLMLLLLLLMMLQTDMELGACHQLIRISLVSLGMSNFCRAEATELLFDP